MPISSALPPIATRLGSTLRRFLLLPVLCGMLLGVSGATAYARASNNGTIVGTVVDGTDHTALAGVVVTEGGKTASTDNTGRYTLSSVSPGTVMVTASNPYYLPASTTVSVARRATVTANFSLVRNWGSVTGAVVDSATGAAVAGASISVSGATPPLTASSDTTGVFSLAKVPAGTQTLSVSAPGYQSATQSIVVTAGGAASTQVALVKSVVAGPGNTISWNGSNTYLFGVNYAWWNYGTDFGTGGWGKYTDWNAVAGQFATMKAQGVRVVRWWIFSDGRYAPDFNADGTVAGLDASFMADVDNALQIAADNNIYLLPTLMDGGMWNNASSSGSVQMGGHAAIITNATVQQSYLDNALKPLLQHVAASPNAKRVLAYDLVNEPESQMAGYWGGIGLSAASVQSFVQRCATYVHQYSGGAYATVGSATPYYVGTWKNLGLDFYQIHYYPWMDFSNGAGSGLPTYASLNLDRPCIVGEFPTSDASYGLSDTAPLSARWYLDSIYTKGYAGALAWSTNVGDSATNWSSFQPLFTAWGQTYGSYIGPR